jgi:hypothetical protein
MPGDLGFPCDPMQPEPVDPSGSCGFSVKTDGTVNGTYPERAARNPNIPHPNTLPLGGHTGATQDPDPPHRSIRFWFFYFEVEYPDGDSYTEQLFSDVTYHFKDKADKTEPLRNGIDPIQDADRSTHGSNATWIDAPGVGRPKYPDATGMDATFSFLFTGGGPGHPQCGYVLILKVHLDFRTNPDPDATWDTPIKIPLWF